MAVARTLARTAFIIPVWTLAALLGLTLLLITGTRHEVPPTATTAPLTAIAGDCTTPYSGGMSFCEQADLDDSRIDDLRAARTTIPVHADGRLTEPAPADPGQTQADTSGDATEADIDDAVVIASGAR